MKHTKTHVSFNEVQPTIRNKPSGLVNNWPRALAKTSPAAHRRLSPLTPSTPSSSTQLLSATPSPLTTYWQPQQSPVMPNVDSFGSVMSAPDTITPFLGHQSLPFHLNSPQSHQSVNDFSQQFFQAAPAPDVVRRPLIRKPMDTSNLYIQVYSFPRKYKDETGKTQVPGLKDLPIGIQSNFCNTFIHHIMKLVFSGTSPWSNPSLSVYQQEFNLIYSPLQYHLYAEDTAVLPVTISNHQQT